MLHCNFLDPANAGSLPDNAWAPASLILSELAIENPSWTIMLRNMIPIHGEYESTLCVLAPVPHLAKKIVIPTRRIRVKLVEKKHSEQYNYGSTRPAMTAVSLVRWSGSCLTLSGDTIFRPRLIQVQN